MSLRRTIQCDGDACTNLFYGKVGQAGHSVRAILQGNGWHCAGLYPHTDGKDFCQRCVAAQDLSKAKP